MIKKVRSSSTRKAISRLSLGEKKKLWKVEFNDGGGREVNAASEKEVREHMSIHMELNPKLRIEKITLIGG